MCKKGSIWDSDPIEPCPYCGADCHADHVDIGVGYAQCGPYHCEECGASQIGPEGIPDDASEEVKETGWYSPESDAVSPYANTINGVIVDHMTAKQAYKIGMLDEKNIPLTISDEEFVKLI